MSTNPTQLNNLPPPPKGQQGITLDQFQHLPPPPKGQTGMTPDQIKSATQPQKPGLQKAGDALGSIFPGKQLGKDVGTSLYGIGQGIKGGVQELAGNKQGAQESFHNYQNAVRDIQPNKDFGDAANIGATIAAPAVGGETVVGRIGANTAIGGAIGGANAISQGQSPGDVAKNAAVGGAIGGGLSAVGEGLNAVTQNLPKWLTNAVLPKLKPGTTEDALNRVTLGTPSGMLAKSNIAVQSHEGQIQSILNHPQYASETGKIGDAIPTLLTKNPNAELNSNKTISILKQVAPNNKTLIDKVANGTATLPEQNVLRKELDKATKAAYGDKPNLSFAKSIGKNMADFLRINVQTTAPETASVFSEYSKELNLNNALKFAAQKAKPKVTMADLIAAPVGFSSGGFKGAAEAVLAEKILRSPTTGIAAAKGISALSKSAPAINAITKSIRSPIIKSATNQ